ncbi:MAG: outer membrane beta-barrel protein [Chthoniobacterales bacterium]
MQVFNRDSASDGGRAIIPLWRVPVHISVSANGGYDENVNTLANSAQGSVFTAANITADYGFGTSRTRGSLHAGTGVTYYPDLSTNRYDPNVSVDLTVTHQANLRLSVNGALSMSYQAEPDFANALGLNRRAGNYFSAQTNLGATYQWLPRFSTISTYNVGTVWYDQTVAADAQNHFDHQFGQSFRFLFLPTTTVVTDVRISLATYDNADRGSTDYALLGGLDHTFLPGLNGTVRAGAGFRSAQQIGAAADTTISPHLEGTLSYLLTGKTSLNWNISYASEESNIATSPGSLSFRTGLQLTHALTPRISSNLSFYYAHTDNQASAIFFGGNPEFSEDALDFSLTFSYALNRYFSANAGYNRSGVESDFSLRSYTRNRYFGGLSVNF